MGIFIIAEAGVNHNGDPGLARRLIDAAVAAGADAVKFQTFTAEKLVSKSAVKAEYQIKNTNESGSQYDMLKSLELSFKDHFSLKEYAESKNIEFMSTAFDIESLRFLVKELGIKRIKVPSGEITNGPTLLEITKLGLPVLLSTGASDIEEIQQALSVLAHGFMHPQAKEIRPASLKDIEAQLKDKVTVLHCVSEYPAPFDEVNLNSIPFIREKFKIPVGFSDHTLGIEIPTAAASLGISVLEKHFTLDKTMVGPDHRVSLDPAELKQLVSHVRNVEKSMGGFYKKPSLSEEKNRKIIRKGITASENIKKGDIFSEKNLTFKRPAAGFSPMKYWEILGKTSTQDYKQDDAIGHEE